MALVYLFDGGGAGVTEVLGPALPPEDWQRYRVSATRLLRARGHVKAAKVLEELPFEHLGATNYFEDEFTILRLTATLDQYVQLSELKVDPKAKEPFKLIAETISEIGPYVRFIVMQLESADDGPVPVAPPSPKVTSEAVESALADAELLLRSRGPASALDRVHTAMHGYLRAALEREGLALRPNASATDLFKDLRTQHPALQNLGTRSEETKRIIMSLASVVDAANTLRNQASGAHPNEGMLESAEAMLVINAVRSLLHYLDDKMASVC